MEEPPMPEGPMMPQESAPEPPIDEPDDIPEPIDEKEPEDNENSEIDDIFGKLDTEKQAAVIKYAKSMVDDSSDEDEPEDDEMQMEGLNRIKSMISEIVNGVLDNEEPKDKADVEDKKVRNKKVTQNNPNISKR